MNGSENGASATSGNSVGGRPPLSSVGHVFGLGSRTLWCLLLLLTTLAPYFYCRFRAQGAHFLWILPPYPEDSLAYLAWERQAMNGAWLLSMKYTALSHAPFLFQPFFLAVGALARITGGALPQANLFAKAVGTVLFVHVWFRFIRSFRLRRAEGLFASGLMALASGLGGWIGIFTPDAAELSADLWLVDLNTYWSLQWNSLFPFSMALILETMIQAEEALRGRPRTHAAFAGLCIIGLALVHPYQAPMLGVYCVVRWGIALRRAAWMPAWVFMTICSLPLAYLLAMWLGHPFVARHATYGRMATPAVPQVLLGLGVPLALAIAGFLRPETRRNGLALFIALALLGAYLPCWFQRKMLFGLHPVVCAAAGLALGTAPLKRFIVGRRLGWAACAFLVALLALSNLRVIKSQVEKAVAPSSANPFAVDANLWHTLEYLRTHTLPSDIVFASPALSALIPAIAGNTVIWGHWAQSIDREQRMATMRAVSSPGSGLTDAQRSSEFWSVGIKYVVVDPGFRQQLVSTDSGWLTRDLEKVWDGGATAVYRRRHTR